MMVVLKIPILYLCAVVWWAIKAEPRPLQGAPLAVPAAPKGGPEPCDHRPRRRLRPGPRPRPRHGHARSPRPALARADARR